MKGSLFRYRSTISILIFCLIFCFKALAQHENGVKPLSIGDTVPDILFKKMINYKTQTAKLSDFKNKAIILDFWATYCVPCITSFPKMQKYQQEYEKDLSVILLSNFGENNIRAFYQKKKNLILPTVFYDSKDDVIDQLFPHKEIPHYVWINKKNVIVAITNGIETNDANIQRLINEEQLDLPLKDDISWANNTGMVLDSIEKYGKANRISINPKVTFQSMIMRYDPRLTHAQIVGKEELLNRYYTLQNASVVHLMQNALGYSLANDYWKFYLDLNDTTLTYPSSNAPSDYRQTWAQNYSYTYRILLDKPDSVYLKSKMLTDLESHFGIKAFKKKIEIPYMVLKSIGDNSNIISDINVKSYQNSSIYNITLRNKPISTLVDILYRFQVGKEYSVNQQRFIPIFDKSNIKGNITLDVKDVDIRNLRELNNELKKYGLELAKEEGPFEMIVITDK